MRNILSYRIGDPRKARIPLDHVAALGVTHLELNLDPAADAVQIKELLAQQKLAAASITAPCKIKDPQLLDTFETYCAKAETLGAPIVFTSVKPEDLPLDAVYQRLRAIGIIAEKHGVKIGIETHPPLCENSRVAAQTMAGVDHPHVGINFDTANVHYYNEGIDTIDQLLQIKEHIVSVHLKETKGGFHDLNFPEFGNGIVDFKQVFAQLNASGFTGPFTMELEGPLFSGKDPVEQEKHLAACVAHLRNIGIEF